MDHRGPEHHYDEVECPGCGAFWQQGEIQPETVRNNCPECGYDIRSVTGGRPYRGQPSPVQSEMTERNTPLDGGSVDRGGNPLKEGILANYDPLRDIELEEKEEEGEICPACKVGRLKQISGTNGPHYKCTGCNNRFRNEEIEADPNATEPAGLGETNPVRDDKWPRGDLTGRPARDEMLGSVKVAEFNDDQETWNEIVNEFQNAEQEEDNSHKVTAASWLDNDGTDSNIPLDHFGWDIVDIVEPSKEITEAQHKYSMPLPEGITDEVHEALTKLNAWVANPDENGKLRPYKEYWSVIRPKISQGSVEIGVEDPHMADIINHIARTNDLSALDKVSSMEKSSFWPALLAPLTALGLGGAEAAAAGAGAAGLGEAAAAGAGAAGLGEAGASMGLGDIAGMMSKAYMPINMLQGTSQATDMVLGDNPPIQYDQPDSIQGFSHTATYGDEYKHPSSINRRIEDPENIDPHQRPDESNDHWDLDMKDVNEIGQSKDNRGTDDAKEQRKRLFAANEEELSKIPDSIKKFLNYLPLIIEFANSKDSGSEDPIIQSVHEALETDFPGYLELAVPEEENIILQFIDNMKNQKKEATSFSPDQISQAPMELGKETPATADRCHNCGTVLDPSNTICPKCGAPAATNESSEAGSNPAWPYGTAQSLVQPYMSQPRQGSSDQGPHTDEQQAAVAELLIEMDREDEIPNMLENPYQYAEELAEIQEKQPLFTEDPEDIPQPQMQPPMPNQGMPPGMPPMETPMPMNAPPAGAPQMMASVKSSMLHAAAKYGADSIAGKCPKCDSHTTKIISQDGNSKCQTCGHDWQNDSFKPADGHSSDLSSTAKFYENLDAKLAELRALDSFADDASEDVEIDDSTHTWKDDSGQPLKKGKEYEIYAGNYDIPDVGRIVEVKPDAVVYEIESDGGLRTTIEIDHKEADLNQYRFVETGGQEGNNPAGIEENMDSKPVPVPGETTDLSTPHIQIGSKVAGKHYTPMEQRELIDEYGEARNADKLDLKNTHYIEADDDYFLFGC